MWRPEERQRAKVTKESLVIELRDTNEMQVLSELLLYLDVAWHRTFGYDANKPEYGTGKMDGKWFTECRGEQICATLREDFQRAVEAAGGRYKFDVREKNPTGGYKARPQGKRVFWEEVPKGKVGV